MLYRSSREDRGQLIIFWAMVTTLWSIFLCATMLMENHAQMQYVRMISMEQWWKGRNSLCVRRFLLSTFWKFSLCYARLLILQHPLAHDSFSRQNSVHSLVDFSNVGIEAVLSEHSCLSIISCILVLLSSSSTEKCDNCELLAVKLALEEWKHGSEGVVDPFLVWTDHKNLEYMKTVKRLLPM